MSDESSEQLSAADTSKKETEEQSEDIEQSDTEKDEDKDKEDTSTVDDKDDENGDAENVSSEEEEELPAGLLEKPVLIEDGKKRERKKVERITFETTRHTSLEIKEGKGRSLGDIPFIEYKLSKMKSEDCKPLHRVLYRKSGTSHEIKRNIRQFSGFPFSKDDKEYEKRLELLKSKKFSSAMIKKIMEVLDIPRNGSKSELYTRLMEWLEKPKDSNRKIPAPKRKRSSTGSKKKGGKKTKKKTADTVADSDDELAESDDDDDDNNEDEEEKADSSDDEEEEKAPPKKKAKKSPPKPAKEKKPRTPKATNKKKITPKKKKEENEDEDDDSSSDDEPLVEKKKSNGPPTNDELKDVIKKMLDNANLEQVTMKTVLKNVFAKYPDYDLLDRKDFIKNTVKQIIS